MIDIPGWFSEADIKTYHDLAINVPFAGKAIEIGVFAGRSAISIGKICQENKVIVYCVDDWSCLTEDDEMLKRANHPFVFETFLTNIREFGLSDTLVPITMKSFEAAKFFNRYTFDLVFIDGNHSYNSVLLDIHSWYHLVKIGGVIAGHDYDKPDVKKAVDHSFEVEVEGNIWIHKKLC